MATDTSRTASVPGRYASALFDLAKQQDAVAKVEADLVSFKTLLDESEDFRRMVRSPVFKSDEQLRALSLILEKVGISGLAANFLKLVTRNRRLFAAEPMIRAFRELAAADRGETRAEVSSAVQLTDAQTAALVAELKAAIGRDVQLEASVDPNLLGGMIVKVGSRMIDSSLRTKLALLKSRMKEVG